jgi:phage baseplate assembly protein W
MPLERTSKGFKDLSLTFKSNPLNQDLITIKNDTAIKRSLRNLVLTYTGERFYNPELGSKVYRLLFNPMSPIISDRIKDEIERTILLYEPRVEVDDIFVDPNFDNNEYNISIKYRVVGAEVTSENLSFVLRATK